MWQHGNLPPRARFTASTEERATSVGVKFLTLDPKLTKRQAFDLSPRKVTGNLWREKCGSLLNPSKRQVR